MNPSELIGSLREQTRALAYQDRHALDAIRRRAEMIIRRIYGNDSQYITDLKRISFSPSIRPAHASIVAESWKYGQNKLLNLLNTMEEELGLFAPDADDEEVKNPRNPVGREVFIVHGHDETMKQAVARTLSCLSFTPVILHEKPNQGRTIIEKFADFANVGFAVILLSPDDVGRACGAKRDSERPRARQNVILELGYFLGKLGRDRVVALYRQERDFEMPSDYSGVLFVPFDDAGRWQFDLAKELRASGYEVDANRLL